MSKSTDDFLQLVSAARTCRRYDASRGLPAGTLSWLVDCAHLTPSAGNLQVLRYITVQSPENRAKFYPALAWAAYFKDWQGPDEKERPTGYIVVLAAKGADGKVSAHSFIDTGIAAQTIQLAAWSKGIGVCMLRSFNPKGIGTVVTLPPELEIVTVLALGYPVEERRIVPLGEDGSVQYYRDDKGVHYVPKRALNEVLVGEY
jgi:nitroreductase